MGGRDPMDEAAGLGLKTGKDGGRGGGSESLVEASSGQAAPDVGPKIMDSTQGQPTRSPTSGEIAGEGR